MGVQSQIKGLVRRCAYAGSKRYCPTCDRTARKFLAFGNPPRPDARCPFCGSLERHRLAILFFRQKTEIFEGKVNRFLHIAPEPAFEKLFAPAIGDGYLTADLMMNHVMERMDITDIQYPDASFDAIYCSHVLEHVPEDRKAMREFFRVLRPTGWAVLNVPITADTTVEDLSITDPAERLRLYGQHDHVRRYGPDYLARLEEAGFVVEVYSPGDLLSAPEIERFGMATGAGEVFFCKKPA